MFRLLRAALLGLVIGIFTLWFTFPAAFMAKVNSFLYEYGMYSNSELKQRILNERALTEQQVKVLPNLQQSNPGPEKLASGELVFTEETLVFQPEQFPPQSEQHLVATDEKSTALWLSLSDDSLSKLQWWQPGSHKLRTFDLPRKPLAFHEPPLTLATPSGLLIFGGTYIQNKKWFNDPARLVFIDPDGHLATVNSQVIRENPDLMVLDDDSVLMIGGYKIEVNNNSKRKRASKPVHIGNSMAVERISYIDKQLQIERLADLPGEPRRGMQMVELHDGRIMVVGGSTSKYAGGKPMTAETHILDLKANSWQPGPPMNMPRSDPALQRLPDGKVLVTGGWTPELDWQDGPSTSTELWDPKSNRFVPGNSLPLPLARHMALWAPAQQGRQLLLLGGMVGPNDGNDQVLALDLASGQWRNVAQNCKDYHGKKSRIKAATVLHKGTPYLLCYKTDTPMETAWSSNTLRLPGLALDSQLKLSDTGYGINLLRNGMAFLPPEKNLPGLVAGGFVNGAQTAAADAILPDGQIISLSPLNHRRANAQVFRLSADAWLVVGGVQGDSSRRTQKFPPPELLTISDGLEQARWRELDIKIEKGAILAHISDTRFVSINPNGSVEQIDFEMDLQSNLRVTKRSVLAPLNRVRNQDFGGISVREVDDGRIIVAGGSVQQHRVAVLNENTIKGVEPDRYQSFGQFVPARYYDIYNPETNRWKASALMVGQAHRFAILPDGRVATWSMREQSPNPNTPKAPNAPNETSILTEAALELSAPNETPILTEAALELSTSDGKQWLPLGGSAPHIDLKYPTGNDHLYAINGELFIAGTMPKSSSGRRLDALEWFNPDSHSWEKLWQATEKENLLSHHGHLVKRKLTNGKKIILPVKAP